MSKDSTIWAGVLQYQELELLDAAGPAAVFAAATGFEVTSVGISMAPVQTRGSLTLLPDYFLENCPHLDVLVVPGGNIDALLPQPELVRWLQAMSVKTNLILSVCTGAFLLAAAGLLDGKKFTTHHHWQQQLQQLVPDGQLVTGSRFVDNGNIITTAGVSAGIDGALHVVKRLKGAPAAEAVAQQLEYPYPANTLPLGREPMRKGSEKTNWLGNK